jgi:FkbM family methyltransferase
MWTLDIIKWECQIQKILNKTLYKFFKFLYNLKIPFFKRLIPSLVKRLNFDKIKIIELSFAKIRVDLSQSIDREIYLNGFYEKKQILFLENICKKNKINHFFDIGANIGYYSLYFNNIKNIYAFEPNKLNFQNLRYNNDLNNFNIKLYNFGLSDSESNSEIWYTDKNKMGGSAIFNAEDPELKKYIYKDIIKEKILIKRLDDIIEIKKSNILIKIDVERHEKKVLIGMEKILKQNKIILQVEIGNDQKKEVFDYLDILGLKWINSIRHDHYFIKDIF